MSDYENVRIVILDAPFNIKQLHFVNIFNSGILFPLDIEEMLLLLFKVRDEYSWLKSMFINDLERMLVTSPFYDYRNQILLETNAFFDCLFSRFDEFGLYTGEANALEFSTLKILDPDSILLSR